MGVEPTRDRAERPPSRFEDGETHRGPYTSMRMVTGRIVPFTSIVVKLARGFISPDAPAVPRRGRARARLICARRNAGSR